MNTNQSEASIQQEIVKFYRNAYCLKHHDPICMIFSVPNESSGPKAMKLIQTGLMPGVADLVVIHITSRWFNGIRIVRRSFLFFEVKTPTGIQSDKQKAFERHCRQMKIGYYLVRSLEDFIEVVKSLR